MSVMMTLSPWIQTTSKCNLACTYCFMKDYGPLTEDMPQEVYHRINMIMRNLISKDVVNNVIYRISGGEPTLVYQNWIPFVDEFIALIGYHPDNQVSILTNGTQIDDTLFHYILEHKIHIQLSFSLDGITEAMYCRPYYDTKRGLLIGSGKIVRDTIMRFIKAKFPIDKIGITTVLTPTNVNSIATVAEFVAKHKISWNISIDHYFDMVMGTDLFNMINAMKKCIEILHKHKYDIGKMLYFNNCQTYSQYGGCAAGHNMIAIDQEGRVYPCHTMIGTSETPICNIMTPDVRLVKEILNQPYYNCGNHYKHPDYCDSCVSLNKCNGGCKLHPITNDEIREARCFLVNAINALLIPYSINKGGF